MRLLRENSKYQMRLIQLLNCQIRLENERIDINEITEMIEVFEDIGDVRKEFDESLN